MPERSRLETRRHKRRRADLPTIAGAAFVVAIALLTLGGGIWLARARGAHTQQALPQAQSQSSRTPAEHSTATAASPKPAAAATETTASSEASTTADPQTLSAAQASIRAAQKAAVRFPGAPALSPTTPSLNHLKPRHNYIALTLDDGYNFQPKLLDLLKQYDVHCTTFLIGSWAASHKSDLKLMKDAGFEISNHSWSHPFLTKLSSARVASELTKTQKVISSVTGNQAPYLRPPFGATNSAVKATAARLGYRIIMWDRTFGDSGRGATPKKLYSNVMTLGGPIQPGDIILCHWGSKPSYEALKRLLPDLRAQGYEFVTVSALIADSK